MSPPIFAISVQAAVLSVISSLLAQFLTAYQTKTSFSLDWEPVIKFFVYAIVSTPPNVLWQDFLERTFPGFNKPEPAKEEQSDKPGKPDDKKQPAASSSPPAETLNIPHTLIKTALDQSLGATVNTALFCAFIAAWPLLTSPESGTGWPTFQELSAAAVARTRLDFWPLMFATWRFWPVVSLGNFALLRDVATRNLVSGLAGVAWGVYVSLVAAAPPTAAPPATPKVATE